MAEPRSAGPDPRDSVDRRQPVAVRGQLAAHRVEVERRELARDGADLAVADLAVVDLDDRRDLRAGAAQEDLVGGVQLASGRCCAATVSMPSSSRASSISAVAGDALEDVVARRAA